MTIEERFWKKVNKTKTCWLWTGAQHRSGSFRRGNFWSAKHGRKVTSHRIAWELKNGNIPSGLYVLHKCDTPLCVRPSHLFLGTQADNIADMDRKGRRKTVCVRPFASGAKNPRAKLNERRVRFIRALYASGHHSQSELAKEFKVSQALISAITKKIIWSNI